jgi:hypothetical protein
MGAPQPVTIQFFGICTHLAPSVIPRSQPVDWYHRVVLVNALDPAAADPKHLGAVKPHHASLQLLRGDIQGEPPAAPWFPITFDDGNIVEWKLDGVTMSVGGHVIPAESPRGIAPCIPSLSDHMQIRPDAGRRAYQQDPSLAACFFDFKPVVIEPRIFVQAAIGVATVFTEEPSLVVTRFGSDESLTIRLTGLREVSLSNIPEDSHDDDDSDFMLHYLALDTFPEEAWFPTATFDCAPHISTRNVPRRLADLTTPGCSNSNYP